MPSTPHAPPTFSLGRLVILVRDHDEALEFYRSAFGARVIFDAPAPGGDRFLHVALDGDVEDVPGDRAPVGIWFLRAGAEDDGRVGLQAGGQPLAVLYTPDVVGAVARVESAGGTTARPVATAGGASFAHVRDLYGNELVLVQLGSGAG